MSGGNAVVDANATSMVFFGGSNNFLMVDLADSMAPSNMVDMNGDLDRGGVAGAESTTDGVEAIVGTGWTAVLSTFKEQLYNDEPISKSAELYATNGAASSQMTVMYGFGTYIGAQHANNLVNLQGVPGFQNFSFGTGNNQVTLADEGTVQIAMGDGTGFLYVSGNTTATVSDGAASAYTLAFSEQNPFSAYLLGNSTLNDAAGSAGGQILVSGGAQTINLAGQAVYIDASKAGSANSAQGETIDINDAGRSQTGANLLIDLGTLNASDITATTTGSNSVEVQTWTADPTTNAQATVVDTIAYNTAGALAGSVDFTWADSAGSGTQTTVSAASLIQALAAFNTLGGGAAFGNLSHSLPNQTASMFQLAAVSV